MSCSDHLTVARAASLPLTNLHHLTRLYLKATYFFVLIWLDDNVKES